MWVGTCLGCGCIGGDWARVWAVGVWVGTGLGMWMGTGVGCGYMGTGLMLWDETMVWGKVRVCKC